MAKLLFALFLALAASSALAQNTSEPQNLLFDDSDILVTAEEDKPVIQEKKAGFGDVRNATASAKELLKQKPKKLHSQTSAAKKAMFVKELGREAPFGLIWGASIMDTRRQGVTLSAVDMKDYQNSYQATKLLKPIDFFEKVFVVYGEDDELYRILAYSKLIDDDSSASRGLKSYGIYSSLLEKKYGGKQEEFTPAVITNVIKNAQGKEEKVTETMPIGNPEFLKQLESGEAVLYSTYQDKEVAAALSLNVDGDEKSYIVIDYKNLTILQKQEKRTLDAL